MQNDTEQLELSPFQRILLIADGTLTKILEAYLTESIQVVKLSENIVSITDNILPLNIKKGCEILERKILLQGKISQRNWLYAESMIVLERLEKTFKEKLINSHKPIGRLWLEYKTETFKEIMMSAREPAGDLSGHFNINREEQLLYRTYRVFTNRQPIMMITEKFPESFFRKHVK